jgi:hypothetical protein
MPSRSIRLGTGAAEIHVGRFDAHLTLDLTVLRTRGDHLLTSVLDRQSLKRVNMSWNPT